jgi:hypothetical protein
MVSVGTKPWLAWELKNLKENYFPTTCHPSIHLSFHPSILHGVHPLVMVHSAPRKWWLVDDMSLPDWTSHAPNKVWMKNDPLSILYVDEKWSICIRCMWIEKGSISSRNMDEKWMITWRFLHSIEFSSTQFFGVEKTCEWVWMTNLLMLRWCKCSLLYKVDLGLSWL